MKSIMLVFIVSFALLFTSCKSEKSELYDQAIVKLKEGLKSPSSAKIEPYNESKVTILLNVGKEKPIDSWPQEESYDLAEVTLKYEAQNIMGVFLAGNNKAIFKRYKYSKDKSQSEWKCMGITE